MSPNGAVSTTPSTSSDSSLSIRGSGSSTLDPLSQVKLLSALRSGDPTLIHPFLTEISKNKQKPIDGDVDTSPAALHLAIRCGSVETVSLLLSYRAISPNGIHPPGSGTTPLHLAASLARVDVVKLLLDQDHIDDSLRDINGKTCKDVAKGKEVARVIEDSRSFLNASYRSQLRTYILSPPSASAPSTLISLLESPRVRFVNLSYLDDSSGLSLLHEAAKRKDLWLIELAVRAGIDVFVRDRRGKMAYESAGKDDHVRVFLRQIANRDTTLIEVPSATPPILKGYLNKYTNVARGYNTRWFVLKAGILSYYRHQEDETVASRGSISMKTAILKATPGGDKLRLEVHSTPSRGHHSIQKWYMKANHPVEASRWVQAISKNIEWYKREVDGERSIESDSSGFRHSSRQSSRQRRGLSSTLLRRITTSKSEISISSSCTDVGVDDSGSGGVSPTFDDSVVNVGSGYEGEVNDDDDGDDDSLASAARTPPHDTTFDLHGNSTVAQMDLTAQLLTSIPIPPDAPPQTAELRMALQDSFALAQEMLGEYVQMAKQREEWWKSRLEREKLSQSVWEESLASVVKEGEALEQELRKRSRTTTATAKSGRFLVGSNTGKGTIRQRNTKTTITASSSAASSIPSEFTSPTSQTSHDTGEQLLTPPASEPLTPTVRRRQTMSASSELSSAGNNQDDDNENDTDDEDEFFDAIESNTLPNLVVPKSFEASQSEYTLPPKIDTELYAGYTNLRTQLNISADNRPSTSLWSVLKHSIGKDLTKISFPVFFNEPTSMLQRMAEDMEFSECLDIAAKETDPHRRIAFVGAFAMSNYSSTIGRIAKPFNPMLSETFEYVRLDKGYRYISEQVSHHPPISACWAESPQWRYYGEVDAQNKFMGKSFEIRPTGAAHAELLLPREWAPGYPKAEGKVPEGRVIEHYSWKKVTTNVSGFILGSPSIDHYGDMIITNHRTGDQCLLTFKPRGWRGKDAFEIAGQVKDASGKVTYEIAGRWNSQLVARAVGTGTTGFLHPDVALSSPNSLSAPSSSSLSTPSSSREYILLWRNSPKTPAPFNLTPFAITLNDCPDKTLRPYLCPTDCRLRPDQKAFEGGQYELANNYKNLQEERQRATRKAREDGRLPAHRPRWFSAETDGDTGERIWAPARVEGGSLEYWVERERVWRQKQEQKQKQGEKVNCGWKDVEPIFIEEQEGIADEL